MREKIENKILIKVNGAPDLTQATQVVVWVRQGENLWEYTPIILGADELMVEASYEDCCGLVGGIQAQIQVVGTDDKGNDFASDPKGVPVGKMLKEEGYCGTN